MARRHNSIRNVLLAGSMLASWPVLAADVTPERLLNFRGRRRNNCADARLSAFPIPIIILLALFWHH
jgi:hypothetical protein